MTTNMEIVGQNPDEPGVTPEGFVLVTLDIEENSTPKEKAEAIQTWYETVGKGVHAIVNDSTFQFVAKTGAAFAIGHWLAPAYVSLTARAAYPYMWRFTAGSIPTLTSQPFTYILVFIPGREYASTFAYNNAGMILTGASTAIEASKHIGQKVYSAVSSVMGYFRRSSSKAGTIESTNSTESADNKASSSDKEEPKRP